MSQSNEYPTSGAESQVLISVLLVDDQKLIGKMVARMLSEELGLRFEHCLDPALALETAERFRPTIILLDLVMPQISGLELLDRFRQRPEYKHMPIIVLSGKEEARTKAEAFARGANDYLVKLPEIVELVARIKHHSKGYINLLQRNAAMEALQESQRKLEIRNRFIRDTFGKFLSDDVVDTVLENPAGVKLGGEQRTVTIMMSDLRGFTSLSERYRAEQVVLLINNYLGVMTDIVLRHHGTIIEFLGDAIFAVFGAPLSKGNDACNAVACAVEMQVAMKEVNDINRAAGLPETEMGIGLNTGEVAVGNIGSERRVKYGVVGQHVNLAARIESFTVGRQILISESTAEACGPILLENGRMEVKPKGVEHPITLHDIAGVGGEFNVYLSDLKPVELFRPETPLPIRFTVIAGKDAGEKAHDGEIVALSQKEALVNCFMPVSRHSNVKFRLVGRDGEEFLGDLYAKVTEEIDKGFRVHLTAMPPEIEAFLRGVLFWHQGSA